MSSQYHISKIGNNIYHPKSIDIYHVFDNDFWERHADLLKSFDKVRNCGI